ncbi:MAG TPA: hypothetical protein VMR59_03135 [Patescibacteria group bacterium]|jgi:hypothetical protein|nr:hypothetical protein [Patescibacteria group bacterium]
MHERDSEVDAIIEEAVKQAQQFALDHPFQIGAGVAHPEDPIVYELRQIDDGTDVATIGYFDKEKGEDIVRQCPLGELFDPRVAFEIAMAIKMGKKFDAAPNN